MKRTRKRLLSLFLACVMLLSLIPLPAASAAGGGIPVAEVQIYLNKDGTPGGNITFGTDFERQNFSISIIPNFAYSNGSATVPSDSENLQKTENIGQLSTGTLKPGSNLSSLPYASFTGVATPGAVVHLGDMSTVHTAALDAKSVAEALKAQNASPTDPNQNETNGFSYDVLIYGDTNGLHLEKFTPAGTDPAVLTIDKGVVISGSDPAAIHIVTIKNGITSESAGITLLDAYFSGDLDNDTVNGYINAELSKNTVPASGGSITVNISGTQELFDLGIESQMGCVLNIYYTTDSDKDSENKQILSIPITVIPAGMAVLQAEPISVTFQYTPHSETPWNKNSEIIEIGYDTTDSGKKEALTIYNYAFSNGNYGFNATITEADITDSQVGKVTIIPPESMSSYSAGDTFYDTLMVMSKNSNQTIEPSVSINVSVIVLDAPTLPSITGAFITGDTNGQAAPNTELTATFTTSDGSTPSDGQVTYQWYKDGTAIDSANGATYTPGNDDIGSVITVKITGDNTNYTGEKTSTGVTIAAGKTYTITASPNLSFNAAVGGAAPAAQDVTITNTGSEQASVTYAIAKTTLKNGEQDGSSYFTAPSTTSTINAGDTGNTATASVGVSSVPAAAGTYKAKLVATNGTDNANTTAEVELTLIVTSGASQLTMDPATLTFTYDDAAKTSTAQNNVGGITSAVSGDTKVATTAVEGTTVTVTPGNVGETTITVKDTGSDAVAQGTATIAVKVNPKALTTPDVTAAPVSGKDQSDGTITVSNYEGIIGEDAKATFKLFDSSGKEVTATLNSTSHKFTGLAAGTYTVQAIASTPGTGVNNYKDSEKSASATVGTPDKYSVTVNVKLDDGNYTADKNVTLTATGVSDELKGVLDANGSVTIAGVPDNYTYTIAVEGGTGTGSVTVNGAPATAPLQFYTLTVEAGGHGTAPTGSGIYLAGTTATVGVTASKGWTHSGWNNGTDTPVTGATYQVNAKTTLTATYTANKVTLGSVNGTGAYGSDSITVTLPTATTDGTAGDTYSYTVEQSADTYTTNGVTINGVTLTGGATGFTIIGTPTKVGDIVFSVRATSDSNDTHADATVTITAAQHTPIFTVKAKEGPHYAGQQTSGAMDVTFSGQYYDGTAQEWKTITDTTDVVTGITYPDATLSTTKNYSAKIDGFADPYKTVWAVPKETSCPITVTAAYTVTVTEQLDGQKSNQGVATLVSGGTTLTGAESENNAVTTFASVPAGTYAIHMDGTATGRTVKVENGDADATLNYTTVKYAAPASGGGSGTIDTGTDDVILLAGGTKNSVTLTATPPQGNYALDKWTANPDTGTFASGNGTWTLPDSYSGGAVTLTPSFKATGRDLTVSLTLDGSTYANSGKSVALYNTSGIVGSAVTADATTGKAVFSNYLDGAYTIYVDGVTTGITFTSSASTTAATVPYFKVKIGDVTAPADASTPATATISAAVGDTAISDDDAVLSGTTVTFILSALDAKYDYKAVWGGGASGTSAPASEGTTTVTYDEAKEAVTAELERNTYTVKGSVKGGGAVTKISISGIAADGSDVNIDGTVDKVDADATNNAIFTNVPASNDVGYTVTLTVDDDTKITTANPVKAVEVAPGAATQEGKFSFTLTGSTWVLSASDGTNTASTGGAASATNNLGSVTYGYAAAPGAVTVTVTNGGNQDLYNVTLTESGGAAFAWSGDDKDDLNTGVTIPAGDSKRFIITPRTGMAVVDGGYTATATLTANKKAGDNTSTIGSIAFSVKFTVAKADQTAPTLTPEDCTGYNTKDGTLTIGNYDSTKSYQWSTTGADNWSDTVPGTFDQLTGVVSGVAPGSYYVRVKGDDNHNDSPASTVAQVKNGTAYSGSVTVTLDGKNEYGGKITGVTFVAAGDDRSKDVAATNTNGVWTGTLSAEVTGYTVKITTTNATYTADLTTTATVSTPTGNNTASTAEAVALYTVSFAGAATVTGVKPAGTELPEANRGVTAKVGGTAIASGEVVLSGAAATFTIDSFDTAVYDYQAAWGGGADGQTSATASGGTANVTYDKVQAEVTADLSRKTYTATGLAGKGITAVLLSGTTLDGADIANAAGSGSGSGAAGGTITFAALPAGNYTVSYTIGTEDTLDADGSKNLGSDEVQVRSDALKDIFKIATTAAEYGVKLGDSETTGDKNEALSGAGKSTYGETPTGYTLTITNAGNRDLYNLTATLGGTNADDFDLGNLSATTLTKTGDGSSATVTLTPKSGLSAGPHTATVTVTANKTDGGASALGSGVVYTFVYTVEKAKITSAVITGVTQPKTGVPFVTTATAAGAPDGSFTGGTTVSWGATGNAAAGTVYTATVTLTPDANHKFDMGDTNSGFTYTINGNANGAAHATVEIVNDKLVLKQTFAPTAPSLGVTLAGTDYNAVKAGRVEDDTSSDAVVYYYLQESGNAPDADTIVAANNTDGVFTAESGAGTPALDPYTQYTVYAVARINDATYGESDWSEVKSADAHTYHKVTVQVDDPAHGGITAPSGATGGSVVVGVSHEGKLTITATETAPWLFKEWTVSNGGGNVNKSTEKSAVYTPGGAAEATVTATYQGSYGITYDTKGGNTGAPTDTTNYPADGKVKLAAYSGTRTGYTFTGWTYDGGTTTIGPNAEVTVADLAAVQTTVKVGEKFKLTAVWTPVAITATAATAKSETTYAALNYSFQPEITAKYLDGPSGAAGSNAVITSYTEKDVANRVKLADLGLNLDTATGAITGRPRQVGNFDLTLTVTAQNGETADVPLTLEIGKATPSLDLKYAAGTYYEGDKLNASLLTSDASNKSVATAPYWDPAGGDDHTGAWVETKELPAAATNGWKFTSDTVYAKGTKDYNVTFTPSGSGADFANGGKMVAADVLYAANTDDVKITALGKNYGIALVDADNTAASASGAFASGVYQEYGTSTITFKVKNTGNQTADLSGDNAYTLTGTNAGVFAVSHKVATVDGGAVSDSAVTVSVNSEDLTVRTYTATLTVTTKHGEKAELPLSFTVTPKVIPSAAVTGLKAPAAGSAFPAASSLTVDNTEDDNPTVGSGVYDFDVASIAWTVDSAPATSNAGYGTVYTATVVLKANDNYTFAAFNGADPNYTMADSAIYALDENPAVSDEPGKTAANTVTLLYTFPATAPGNLAVAEAKANAHTTGDGAASESGSARITVDTQVSVDVYYVVNTSAAALTAAEIVKADGVDAAMKGKSTVAPVNGKAEWAGISITGLDAGETYYVHAAAAPAGTASYGNVDTASFTTWYKVEVVSDPTEAGSITLPGGGVTFVEPGESTKLVLTVGKDYTFKEWRISATDTTPHGAVSNHQDNATADGIHTISGDFKPTHNAVVTATYTGAAALKVEGVKRSNQVTKDYTVDLNIFDNAKVTNTGAAALSGNLAFKLVAEGDLASWQTAPEYTNFLVDTTAIAYHAADGAAATAKLPARGGYADGFAIRLKTDGGNLAPGIYTAYLIAYDSENGTVMASTKLEVVIVDGVAVNPVNWTWDLNQRSVTNREQWDMTILPTSFNKFVSLTRDGVDVLEANYSFVPGNGTDTASTLVLTQNYLESLAGESGRKAGDTVTFALTMGNGTEAENKEATLKLHFIDTTPEIKNAEISYNEPLAVGSVLTASASAMLKNPDGTDWKAMILTSDDYDKVTFTWYKVVGQYDPSSNETDDEVVGTNSATFTLTTEGSYYVVVSGIDYDAGNANSGYYRGSAAATATGAAQYTVTVERKPAAGGLLPIHGGKVHVPDGGHTELTAAEAKGYHFTGWSVAANGGTFTAKDAQSAGSAATFGGATTWFWPKGTTTVTANFDLLPTLTLAPGRYNIGSGAGNKTAPVFTYAKNDGSLKEIVVTDAQGKTVATLTNANAGDAFTMSAAFGEAGTYTLKAEWIAANLTATGAYTFTFVDGNAYDTGAALTIEKVNKDLPAYTIVAVTDGADHETEVTASNAAAYLARNKTVKAKPAAALDANGSVTYVWYHGEAGLSAEDLGTKATVIEGENAQTLKINDALATAMKGRQLYVLVTGGGAYEGSRRADDAGPAPVPTYTVTANGTNPGGKVSVNGAAAAYAAVTGTASLGGFVNLTATPDDGYRFDKWTPAGGTGTFGSATGVTDAEKSATAAFYPTADATVNASFVPGAITFADGAGQAKYMTQTLIAAPAVKASSDGAGTVGFTYAAAAENDKYGDKTLTADDVKWPAWLEMTDDGTFRVKAGEWVDTDVAKDSTTEVTVYVKAAADKGGAAKVAKFTIDIIPGDLTIDPDLSYDVTTAPTVGDPLDVTKLQNTTVTNAKPETVPDGTWTVTNAGGGTTFTGTSDSYTFTVTAPANQDGSYNYNPASKTITISGVNPAQNGIGVKDGEASGFTNDQVRDVSKTYLDAMGTYTVSVKNTGSSKLYDLEVAFKSGSESLFALTDNVTGKVDELDGGAETDKTFVLTPKGDALLAGSHTVIYTVTGWTADNQQGEKVTATYTLTLNVAPKTLDGLKVTVDDPETGKPFPTPSVDGGIPGPDANGKTPYTVTVTWEKKDGAGKWVPVSGDELKKGVQPNTEYRPTVTATADSNYVFVTDGGSNYAINGKADGGEGSTAIKVSNADKGNTVTLAQDLAKTEKTQIKEVTVNVPDLPTDKGTHDSFPPNDNSSPLYDVKGDWEWKDKDGNKVTTFEAGETYTLVVTVTPQGDNEFDPDVTIKVRGENVTATKKSDGDKGWTVEWKYKVPGGGVTPPPTPGPGPSGGGAKLNVTYQIDAAKGSTKDKTKETVEEGSMPANVPAVTVKDEETLVFVGWTLDPKAEKLELVKPETKVITEDTTFYAVFAELGEHEHYIIGYPNGNFGPGDNITRGEVATIIARACLEGFDEDADYGNPGNYSDVSGHWAESAIAYVTMAGVFVGRDDGTFAPNLKITRQEFALVIARMDGLKSVGDMPFSDATAIADWAVDGVYTTTVNGWVNGYTDGTFKPWNDIRRDEAVKIFNMYLNRGTDAPGLTDVAGDYKTWPDVPTDQWAYHHIIEASNDHKYFFVNGMQPPEHWTECWVNDRWKSEGI